MTPESQDPGAGSGDELLPCPFCGSPAEIKEDCGTFEPGCSHCGSFFGFHSTREHAARSWNRRATPPAAEGCVMPEGFVLVPLEPTESMVLAALEATDPLGRLVDWQSDSSNTREAVRDAYAAMLSVAPPPASTPPSPMPSARRGGEDEVERVAKAAERVMRYVKATGIESGALVWVDTYKHNRVKLYIEDLRLLAALAAAPVAQEGDSSAKHDALCKIGVRLDAANETLARIASDLYQELATPTAQPSEGGGQEGGEFGDPSENVFTALTEDGDTAADAWAAHESATAPAPVEGGR